MARAGVRLRLALLFLCSCACATPVRLALRDEASGELVPLLAGLQRLASFSEAREAAAVPCRPHPAHSPLLVAAPQPLSLVAVFGSVDAAARREALRTLGADESSLNSSAGALGLWLHTPSRPFTAPDGSTVRRLSCAQKEAPAGAPSLTVGAPHAARPPARCCCWRARSARTPGRRRRLRRARGAVTQSGALSEHPLRRSLLFSQEAALLATLSSHLLYLSPGAPAQAQAQWLSSLGRSARNWAARQRSAASRSQDSTPARATVDKLLCEGVSGFAPLTWLPSATYAARPAALGALLRTFSTATAWRNASIAQQPMAAVATSAVQSSAARNLPPGIALSGAGLALWAHTLLMGDTSPPPSLWHAWSSQLRANAQAASQSALTAHASALASVEPPLPPALFADSLASAVSDARRLRAELLFDAPHLAAPGADAADEVFADVERAAAGSHGAALRAFLSARAGAAASAARAAHAAIQGTASPAARAAASNSVRLDNLAAFQTAGAAYRDMSAFAEAQESLKSALDGAREALDARATAQEDRALMAAIDAAVERATAALASCAAALPLGAEALHACGASGEAAAKRGLYESMDSFPWLPHTPRFAAALARAREASAARCAEIAEDNDAAALTVVAQAVEHAADALRTDALALEVPMPGAAATAILHALRTAASAALRASTVSIADLPSVLAQESGQKALALHASDVTTATRFRNAAAWLLRLHRVQRGALADLNAASCAALLVALPPRPLGAAHACASDAAAVPAAQAEAARSAWLRALAGARASCTNSALPYAADVDAALAEDVAAAFARAPEVAQRSRDAASFARQTRAVAAIGAATAATAACMHTTLGLMARLCDGCGAVTPVVARGAMAGARAGARAAVGAVLVLCAALQAGRAAFAEAMAAHAAARASRAAKRIVQQAIRAVIARNAPPPPPPPGLTACDELPPPPSAASERPATMLSAAELSQLLGPPAPRPAAWRAAAAAPAACSATPMPPPDPSVELVASWVSHGLRGDVEALTQLVALSGAPPAGAASAVAAALALHAAALRYATGMPPEALKGVPWSGAPYKRHVLAPFRAARGDHAAAVAAGGSPRASALAGLNTSFE